MRPSGRCVVSQLLVLLLLPFWLTVPGVARAASANSGPPVDPSTAIVKIYVAAVMPDAFAPWRPGFSSDKTGSGAVIEGRRILTNAHVVEGHTFVQVRLHGHPEKLAARVTFLSHEADLALLELEEPARLDGIEPLPLGDLPALRAEVSAFGFPTGGDTLSITKGVVTRVEHVVYLQSWARLLAIQMDAAIGSGSSGGPLVHDGALVGVAAQTTVTNDTIGCAVAVPVVRQFLEDVSDGRVDGVPSLRVSTQPIENPALRASLGVPEGESGALVRTVAPVSPAAGILLPGDVLTTVDGLDLADDSTVELRGRERTDLSYAVDRHQVGETAKLRFLRDGKVHEAEVGLSLALGEAQLIPQLHEQPGDYYIYGGLVFLAFTRDYIIRANEINAFNWALTPYITRELERPGEQVILLQSVLTAAVNQGYREAAGEVIESVDGQPVSSLRELAALAEEGDGAYVTFGYRDGGRVTLDREEARRATPGLLQRHGIASDRSAGLRADPQVASTEGSEARSVR
jgi:S1-C subfamily serine protease